MTDLYAFPEDYYGIYDQQNSAARLVPIANILIPPAVVTGTTDTLAAADHGQTNRYTNASQVTVTLPTDAADPDVRVGFWTALYAEGAGGVTVNLNGLTATGSSPNLTIAQNETMVVRKVAASTWMIVGGTAA